MLRSDIAFSSRPHSLVGLLGNPVAVGGMDGGRVGKLFLSAGHWVARAKGIRKGFLEMVIPEMCQSLENIAETLATAGRAGVYLSVSVETALSLD